MKKYCKIRQDLLDQNLKVPIGNSYYTGSKRLYQYMWRKDKFYIKFRGRWQEALSIDFDF
jgi:hypothetical protein